MERKEIELHCIVEKEGGMYSALCFELDVASCGKTPEKAAENLKEAIELYLEYAVNSGRFDELVPRSVPKDIQKEYQKKLRKKSSERQERLRRESIDYDYIPGRVAFSYQYA